MRETPGQMSLLEIQNFHAPEAERERHDTRWRGMETISCQLGRTSRPSVAYDTVLENRGTVTVYIRDNSYWSYGRRLEVTQYVNQSMGFSCEIWPRCFVRDQRSQAAPNFLLSLPVAAD